MFNKSVGDTIGIRTRELGAEVMKHPTEAKIEEKKAKAAAAALTKLWKSERNEIAYTPSVLGPCNLGHGSPNSSIAF